jgi:hyperosmotically inducible periplasmic protein
MFVRQRMARRRDKCWVSTLILRFKERAMTVTLRTLAVLAILSLTVACQSMTGRTTGQNVDDATLTASVKAKLVGDKVANLTRVDVDTTNATVALNGVVETPSQKTRAEMLAKEVKGVQKVVNNLQVQKP